MKPLLAIIFLCSLSLVCYSKVFVVQEKDGELHEFEVRNIKNMYFEKIDHPTFNLSKSKVSYNTDYSSICAYEFGEEWSVADWENIKDLEKSGQLDSFVATVGFGSKKNAWVERNGDQSHSKGRDYFMSFHNHNKPGHYLAHDNVDNFLFSLGSWDGKYYILCRKNNKS